VAPRIFSWAVAGKVARTGIAAAANDVVKDECVMETSSSAGWRTRV